MYAFEIDLIKLDDDWDLRKIIAFGDIDYVTR